MLIQGLCDYYDILAAANKVLPDGYSNVKIHYLISLTEEGRIDEIINYQKTERQDVGGKVKERLVPRERSMPQRTEKSGIEANIIEHRPLYLFGLNCDKGEFSPEDRTNKARKSHQAFVEANLAFTGGMTSPVVQAFRNFMLHWEPEKETENPYLVERAKDYGKSGFAFCLSGRPDRLLHEEPEIKEKWDQEYQRRAASGEEGQVLSQCAISGERMPIARIHSKIKGVYGGLATGSVLIGFNNPSENSYGAEQSYNSNISEGAMKKYTEALNYLLGSAKHKVSLDDMTVVFWAMDPEEACENLLMNMLFRKPDQQGAEQTEGMIEGLLKDAAQGRLTEERLQKAGSIKPGVDFYMVGLKPNSSRLAVKFIYRRKFGDILQNIAKFQKDLQMSEPWKPVSIARIKRELVSPKSTAEKVNPALISGLFRTILEGDTYPRSLLETTVRRVKTDCGLGRPNIIRVGIIKGYINRKAKREELNMGLDKENVEQAYLCGRLFAVLEKLQQEASGGTLNRTIRDTYFASATANPVLVFPKLMRLAQNHLNKVRTSTYYNKLIGEIINPLNGGFPTTLCLEDQGRFVVGYYQQYQSFFEKKEKKENGGN